METTFQNNPLIKHVYIHIPFCLRKCNYCSFYSEKYSFSILKKYIDYLVKEIKFFHSFLNIKPTTIYLGGGTPSLLTNKILNKILFNFNLSEIKEITLEANPVNINLDYASELAKSPVNRVSLGAQSFLDKELKLLGRLHNSQQIYKSYNLLRNKGIKNISLDLIYGLPNQSKQDLIFSIEKIIALNPVHISIYCLSLENNVPLYNQKSQIPSDDILSEYYFLFRERLICANYEQYEISNFAKKGYASQHNLCYWNVEHYLGLGASASGYIKNFRYTNPANIDEYFIRIENNLSSPFYKNSENIVRLSFEDKEKEFIFLNLRKTEGLNLDNFKRKFEKDFLDKYSKIVQKYKKNHFLIIINNNIKLDSKAYFVSNEIFSEFV